MKRKTIFSIVVIALIVGSIYYLESKKAGPSQEEIEVVVEPAVLPERTSIVEESTESANLRNSKNDFLPEELYEPNQEKITSLNYPQAPELVGIYGYLNAQPFKLEELRGKVVLIDFWTYTCINCIRTQPYLNAWHDAYADDGLVIVGVHTPEFEFEKDFGNVKQAVEAGGLKYPVVQDNNYETWRAYKNRFWPHKYLIDMDGLIRYDHIGEGAYSETEQAIQGLLEERKQTLGMTEEITGQSSLFKSYDADDLIARTVGTPEIYFGYKFTRGNFGSPEGFKPEEVVSYAVPQAIVPNKAFLTGDWENKADYSELKSERGSIILNYGARLVNIVASSNAPAELNLLLNGKPLSAASLGGDGNVVSEEKLYNIVTTFEPGQNTLEIQVNQPGFRIYTFTFG